MAAISPVCSRITNVRNAIVWINFKWRSKGARARREGEQRSRRSSSSRKRTNPLPAAVLQADWFLSSG